MASSLAEVDAHFPKAGPCPLPVSRPTPSFWLRDSPLADIGRHEPLPEDVDICIIGSGISGIGALYHAVHKADRALRVVVLEARGGCSGATGRNGGHCSRTSPDDFVHLETRDGIDEAVAACRLEARCIDQLKRIISDHHLDVDLVSTPRVTLFENEEQAAAVRDGYKRATEAGVGLDPIRWYSREELEAELGVKGFHSGVSAPANNLWPHKLVAGLLRLAQEQAQRAGHTLSLHTHTPVTSMERADGDGWRIVTSRGTTRARVVLHATNGYATHLLPGLCQGRAIVPCRNQVIAVRPSPQAAPWKTSFYVHEGFDYVFQRPRDDEKKAPLVILGGGRHVVPPPHELDVADDSKVNPGIAKYLRSWLPKYFAGIFATRWFFGGVSVEAEWSGIMGMTASRDPLVGAVDLPDHDGQFISAGFSGHGMSRTFSCAEHVVEMMLAKLDGKPEPAWPDWLPRHFAQMK